MTPKNKFVPGKKNVSPYIYIGSSCNNNCIFCSEADEYLKHLRKKSLNEIKKEIRKVRSAYDFVSFMGREPTQREDFFDIITFAKTLEFRQISVATNGRLLAYPAFAVKCLAAGVNQVGISFNSADKRIHDRLTAVPGSFQQTVKGIKNLIALKESGLSILINIPLNQKNYLSLEKTIDFLIGLGVKEINILWTAPLSRRSRSKEIVSDMADIGQYAFKVLSKKKYKYSPVKFLLVEFLPCSLPKEAREMFFPCLEKNSNKVRIPICEKCGYRNKCDGVLKDYIDLYGIKKLKI